MKESNLSIGEKIKSLRVDKGLTQEELSKELMITRQSISSWERNKSIPDIEMLQLISKYFGVSNDYLVLNGYSRIKDKLLKYNIWVILSTTALFTIVIIFLFITLNNVYDNKFRNFKGVCSDSNFTEIIYDEDGLGYEIVIDEKVEVELDGTVYCFPIMFAGSSNQVNEDKISIDRVTGPSGLNVSITYASINRNENDEWMLLYRVKLGILDDKGQMHEEVVSSNHLLNLEIDNFLKEEK